LHDNAPEQSYKCWSLFDPKSVTTIYHPPYSPDLSQPDYFLFLKLKIELKGLHFVDVAEIQVAITNEL
jgi:hypothetical protein